jgi:uncharacterized protein (TIGR02001 family)
VTGGRRIRLLRLGALAWATTLLPGAPALAQLSGSVRIDSDYRWRGESLSDERPAPRLNLGWDGEAGGFAGLSLGRVRLIHGLSTWHVMAHAGYVRRGEEGRPGWELGVVGSHFPSTSVADYGELFAGLVGEQGTLRLRVSPNYFGLRVGTAYVEYDTARELAPGWRGQLHLGALKWLGHGPLGVPDGRVDLRLGVSRVLGDGAELQLAWNTQSGRALYPILAPREPAHSAWTLSLSYAF